MNAGNSSSPYLTLTLPSDLLTYNVRVAAVNTQGRTISNALVIMCSGTETGMLFNTLLLLQAVCVIVHYTEWQ